MKSKGARLTTELSLPGRFLVYVPYGEGMGVSRRVDDQERTRLKEIVRELDAKGGGIIVRTAAEGASAEDIERDLVFLQRLWKTIQAKAEGATAPGARVRGGRAAPAHRARPLRRRLRRCSDRRRSHSPQDRQLPEEDLAAHDRAGASLSREDAALRGLGSRAGDPLHARPAGRPALGRISRLRLRGGVHRHRRQHGTLRRFARQVRGRSARRHDREEQPRGREGGRAPAPAARHRRDHRHRLHRHGEPQEPLDRRGRTSQRARARPDEDLRGRDLTARARRDDTPERHRRPARDPHDQVRRVRRRRLRRVGGDARARDRAKTPRGREGLAGSGVPHRRPSPNSRAAGRSRAVRGSRRSRRPRDAASSSFLPQQTTVTSISITSRS